MCKTEDDWSVVQIHNDSENRVRLGPGLLLLSRLCIVQVGRVTRYSLSLMLNVWKRTWKGNDPSPKRSRLDEPSNTASSLDVAEAVHPSDTMSLHLELSPDVATSPLKEFKTQPAIQGHCEQLDLTFEDQVLRQAKFENSKFPYSFLPLTITHCPQAIVFVPHSLCSCSVIPYPKFWSDVDVSITATTNILARYLDWAVGIERARHMIANKRHRSAFLVAKCASLIHLGRYSS